MLHTASAFESDASRLFHGRFVRLRRNGSKYPAFSKRKPQVQHLRLS